MNNFISSIHKYIKISIKNFFKTYFWIKLIFIILILIFFIFGGSDKKEQKEYIVMPDVFIQNVLLTGKVIAAKNVDMAFETSGRVNNIAFKVGDRVKKGQVIAKLSAGDIVSNLNKSYAGVLSESARLIDVKNGNRIEEIKIAEGDLKSAELELNLSKQVLKDEIRNLYNKADESIRLRIDNSFKNPRSSNPEFSYLIDQNQALYESLKFKRMNMTTLLDNWSKDMLSLDLNNLNEIDKIRNYSNQVFEFINDINTAISIVAEKSNINDINYTIIQNQKNDIVLARSNYINALNLFNQSQISFKNSITTYTRAQNTLNLKTSGGTKEAIQIQQAALKSAEANVQNAKSLLSKTFIVAPFDGVITKVDIKEGEISSPNTPVISMINDGEYQIETYVSENDIAKLSEGQKAKITLDAYGRDVFFDAVIISVDPSETLKDGVSTYRTKIQFIEKDERVKSGMTSNIDIETDKRENIISIPLNSIINLKGEKYVQIKNEKDLRKVVTGTINNMGYIEIINGLEKGEMITYTENVKK